MKIFKMTAEEVSNVTSQLPDLDGCWFYPYSGHGEVGPGQMVTGGDGADQGEFHVPDAFAAAVERADRKKRVIPPPPATPAEKLAAFLSANPDVQAMIQAPTKAAKK